MNTDQIQGKATDLKGHVEDGVGGLTGDTKLQMDGKVDQAAGKLQGRFGETIEQVNEAASEAARRAAELAGDVGGKLRDAAKTVGAEARHAGGAVYESGARAGEAVGRTVQQQPLLALIGAAAIGYIASFLIHSPSSPFAPPPPPRRDLRQLASYYRR